MKPKANLIYTIGHSSHDIAGFLHLLKLHEVSVVADVRSSPYSRYLPRFNREQLQNDLAIARAELQRAQEELHVSKHDNDIYAISVYLGMIAIALYGLYRLVGPFSTSDRTEL